MVAHFTHVSVPWGGLRSKIELIGRIGMGRKRGRQFLVERSEVRSVKRKKVMSPLNEERSEIAPLQSGKIARKKVKVERFAISNKLKEA